MTRVQWGRIPALVAASLTRASLSAIVLASVILVAAVPANYSGLDPAGRAEFYSENCSLLIPANW
ncbi:MAG TPA: hypothetical protein VE130_00080 [Nitrososphaeraceae archaeon]|nr:hypothetical protein [Nitrososphaeraceae archaeon]